TIITLRAHCLLHLSESQHRIALASENSLALIEKLFAVNFARFIKKISRRPERFSDRRSSPMAWYAYCIVEQQAFQNGIRARRPVPIEGLKGIADSQIFAYPSGDFSVLVSEYIPTGDLGQKALLQHAHVVSECFKRTTVLPFRFGTVF